MRELVSFPGAQFELNKLGGSLEYSFSKNGKERKRDRVHEEDFEDLDQESHHGVPLPDGVEVSAVGLNLRLFRNDGTLHFNYENERLGVTAAWEFSGLKETSGRVLSASAQTQTGSSASDDVKEILETKDLTNSAIQTDPVVLHLHDETCPQIPDLKRGNATLEPSETQEDGERSSKRKRPDAEENLTTFARSREELPPWPKHLFMEGYRTKPYSKGGDGNLYIDVQEAKAWYIDVSGNAHTENRNWKRIDLRNKQLKVCFERSFIETHLTLVKPSLEIDAALGLIFCLRGQPRMKIWGNNDKSSTKEFIFRDPCVIVDALVYCIDRTSNRDPPVHDPYADSEFKTSCAAYQERARQGRLGHGADIDYEKLNVENELRKKRYAMLRECNTEGICQASSPSDPRLEAWDSEIVEEHGLEDIV